MRVSRRYWFVSARVAITKACSNQRRVLGATVERHSQRPVVPRDLSLGAASRAMSNRTIVFPVTWMEVPSESNLTSPLDLQESIRPMARSQNERRSLTLYGCT